MMKRQHFQRFTATSRGKDYAADKDTRYKASIYKWFLNLTVDERALVLALEDPEGVKLIQKMFQIKSKFGEGLFFRDEDTGLSSEPSVCFRKLTHLSHHCFYPETLIERDRQIEQAVRICDTKNYLDTICVGRQYLENGKRFLQLMEIASRGGFLTVPCRVAFEASAKQWVWTTPSWFEGMGYFSLGTFIAHKLEQVLWMRFWESTKEDPRVKITPSMSPKVARAIKAMKPYKFETDANQRKALLSKDHLLQFWVSRSYNERRRIVPSLGNIVEHVLMSEDELSNTKKLEGSQKKDALDYPKLLSSLVDISTEKKTVALFFKENDFLMTQEQIFIEMLYFSPLVTAGTPLDMVLRRIGLCIQRGYIEKLAMDLILGEETEKIKKATQQVKKGGKKKGKNKKRRASLSSPKRLDTKKIEAPKKEEEKKASIVVRAKDKAPLVTNRKEIVRNTVATIIDEIITTVEMTIDEKNRQAAKAEQNRRKQRQKQEQQQQQQQLPKHRIHSGAPRPVYSATPSANHAHSSHNNHGHSQSCGAIMMGAAAQRQPTAPPSINKNRLTTSLDLIMPVNKNSVVKHADYRQATLAYQNGWSVRKRSTSQPTLSCDDQDVVVAQPASYSSSVSSVPSYSSSQSYSSPSSNASSNSSSPRSSLLLEKGGLEVSFGEQLPVLMIPDAGPSESLPLPTTEEKVLKSPVKNGRSEISLELYAAETKQKAKAVDLIEEAEIAAENTPEAVLTIPIAPVVTPINNMNNMRTLYVSYSYKPPPPTSIAYRLNKEIVDYVNYVKRVVQEHNYATAGVMVERVRICVNKIWPTAKVELYGSFGTCLCIPSSDLDLVVVGASGMATPDGFLSAFELLKRELEKQVWVESFHPIATAKVPVIKVTSYSERIPTDITFASDATIYPPHFTPTRSLALPSSSGSRRGEVLTSTTSTANYDSGATVEHSGIQSVKLVLKYKELLPALEPLSLVLKQFLHERGLNNSYTGGLSSYCLVLMIISFLQLFGYDTQGEQKDLGTLLLEFFEYYGKKFNYQTTGITIQDGGKHFPLDSLYHKFGAASLVLLDPFNPSKNVAYSTFSMWRVKCAFEYAYATLSNSFTMNSFRSPTLLSCILLHAQFQALNKKGYTPHHFSKSLVKQDLRPRTRVVDDNEVYENRRKERQIQHQQPLQVIYSQNGYQFHD